MTTKTSMMRVKTPVRDLVMRLLKKLYSPKIRSTSDLIEKWARQEEQAMKERNG